MRNDTQSLLERHFEKYFDWICGSNPGIHDFHVMGPGGGDFFGLDMWVGPRICEFLELESKGGMVSLVCLDFDWTHTFFFLQNSFPKWSGMLLSHDALHACS